jgi:diguanylate cyclase (GGDEF)-like protein/PAS domain S-box-containing protein
VVKNEKMSSAAAPSGGIFRGVSGGIQVSSISVSRIPWRKVRRVDMKSVEMPAKTILLIEDDGELARLIHDMLNNSTASAFELTHVESMSGAEKYLAGHSVDVVLLDLELADRQGLETVRLVRAAAPRVPIVLLSSADNEAIAVQAIQNGVQDYLVKGQIEPRELMRSLLNSAERKKIEETLLMEKERAEVTLECIGDAVICTDRSGYITFINRVAESMTGWSGKDASGRPMAEACRIVDAISRKAILDPMSTAASQNRTGKLPMNSILIGRDGHETFIEDSVAPIHDRDGQVTGAVIVFRDVSATQAFEKKLTHSAQHDFLTELPNRTLLSERVSQAIALARRQRHHVAVLFLDLDNFKQINDSLGHQIGDKLLQSVAKRLVDSVRGPDTVSRFGGDEFVVLLRELKSPEEAAKTAGRLLKAVSDVHFIDQHQIYTTASIGVCVDPGYGSDAVTLIENADAAMYHVKRNGRQHYKFFSPGMIIEAVKRQSVEQDLLHALDRNEFTLLYQPKIDLKTGSIVGAEALSRWMHPTRGSVPPAQFIPIAEESGLILRIGAWALREACKQARAWVDGGKPARTMAVNISGTQFQSEDFLESLSAALSETGLDPESLELDIAEKVLMNHPARSGSILESLRSRKIKVSVDNFGTGYSCMNSLQKLPLSALKIDQSLVRAITCQSNETAKVGAIIEMGQHLNLRVVAEGVETSEDLEFLWEHNCDEAQGYYFGQPVPPEHFGQLFC